MMFGSGQILSTNDLLIYIILDNELIKNVENQKLLGIIIDKCLTWEKQIPNACLILPDA